MAKLSSAHSVRTPGVEFSYREGGVPTGIPVILTHGFPDAPSTWDAVLERIDAEALNVRLIVPWGRGYGETRVLHEQLVSGEIASMATDVFALADALGIGKFALIGHDWGARSGYAACVLDPERILGLFALSSPYGATPEDILPPEQVDAYWYQWHFQTTMGERSLRKHAKEFCHHIWERWSPHWGFGRGEFNEAAESWESDQFVEIVLHAYRHVWGNALSRPAYAAAQAKLDATPKPRISVPTLYAHGSDDHCVLPMSSEGQKAFFSGKYESVTVKGAGHFPQREDPKMIAKLMERFVTELRK